MSKYIGCLTSITFLTSLGLMNKLSFITNCFSLFFIFSFVLSCHSFCLLFLFGFSLSKDFFFLRFYFLFLFSISFNMILAHLTWRQRWESCLFTFMRERISIGDPIVDNISIIFPRSPKQHMSNFHGNHITKHFINILSNGECKSHLLIHNQLTIVTQPLQLIRLRVRGGF